MYTYVYIHTIYRAVCTCMYTHAAHIHTNTHIAGHYLNNTSGGSEHLDSQMIR